MSAGEYVRRKRLQRGMSQRQLAAVSGISNSEISRIEAGERSNPSPGVLRLLASALGVPYEEILAEAGYLADDRKSRGAQAGTAKQARRPEWVYTLPPDLYEFVREESARGWPYMRLARGLSRKELDPSELQAIVQTWMEAKKRYEKGPDRKE